MSKMVNTKTQIRKSKLAIAGLVLAFLLPPVGCILSVVALVRIRRWKLGGKGLAIAGTLIGALLMVPGVLLALVFFALGGARANQAEVDFKPIDKQLIELGATKICTNGDNGWGIDNATPWYDIYYQAPDTAGLTDKVSAIATDNGYTLSTNQDFVNQLKGVPDANGDVSAPYGNEQFNPKSDYLKGSKGPNTLTLTINRQASVALYCNSDSIKYGEKRDTGSDAILTFSLTLPDNQR
jgi:hypothetical protein